MGLFNKKEAGEGMNPLGLQGEKGGKEVNLDAAAEPRAEQLHLFKKETTEPTAEAAEKKSLEQIGNERIALAVEKGKEVFSRVSGFFRSALAYAVAPDVAMERAKENITNKVGETVENLSNQSENFHNAISERFDAAGSGVDSFIDEAKSGLLAKFAKMINLGDTMKARKIISPEAKNSILGLKDSERSMGGELIVSSTIFDRVKEFSSQVNAMRKAYKEKQKMLAEQRQTKEEWVLETAKKESEERQVFLARQLERARAGETITFASWEDAQDVVTRLGGDDGFKISISNFRASRETNPAASEALAA